MAADIVKEQIYPEITVMQEYGWRFAYSQRRGKVVVWFVAETPFIASEKMKKIESGNEGTLFGPEQAADVRLPRRRPAGSERNSEISPSM